MLAAAGASQGRADAALVLVELGAVVVGVAVLARLAMRARLSPIPLYLLAGLAFGAGGLVPLEFSESFIEIGAQIGVVLLLFMLGLEYTAEEFASGVRTSLGAGLVDFGLNFTPGLVAGLVLGWSPLAAVLLGGATYISSSGVVAKTLGDLDRLGNRETPSVLSVLVIEDLAMAVYLPIVAVLLVGAGLMAGMVSLAVALAAVAVALGAALRFGGAISRAIDSRSDEVVLLTVLGLVLVVAGLAERLQVSSAVGAFLVGIALSEPVADRARDLLGPLRDLFAAVFFVFFGLQIDPGNIPPVAGLALGLGAVTVVTKLATGWWAARSAGVRSRGRLRAGTALVARGEFSVVIAGLGVSAGVEPILGPAVAAYVLVMVVAGSLLARFSDPLLAGVQRWVPGLDPPAGAAGPRAPTDHASPQMPSTASPSAPTDRAAAEPPPSRTRPNQSP